MRKTVIEQQNDVKQEMVLLAEKAEYHARIMEHQVQHTAQQLADIKVRSSILGTILGLVAAIILIVGCEFVVANKQVTEPVVEQSWWITED